MKHPLQIDGYTLEDLVNNVSNLRYDKLSEFLSLLSKKIQLDALKDGQNNKPKLSKCLFNASDQIHNAKLKIDNAWDNSKKYMMDDLSISEIAFTKAKLPYGWLGNMSAYPVVYNDLHWPSTEALFQALRFPSESEYREIIRLEKNPFKGKLIAKANRDKMSIEPTGEVDIENMRLCIRLKIEQHPDLKNILVDSGNIPIYEDVTSRGRRNSNLIWGALKLPDGTWEGQNVLGVLWMELREELRNKQDGK